MKCKVCALPTWLIICEFPSPFARIRKLPWWSPSSLPVEVAKEWDAHAEGWISGESTWRQFFRFREGLLRQPGETSDDGLAVRSCIILQLQYNVLWIPGRPSWLLFELSCQMCTFIFGFVDASYGAHSSFSTGVFLETTSLAYLNPPTKTASHFLDEDAPHAICYLCCWKSWDEKFNHVT